MSDERGGRYFREARFFLGGDKVAAQSHILDARGLLGYLRDQHAMGGPPILVKYAILKDGTQIKAVMMNGQYQAEIVSPAPGPGKCRRVRVPTIGGSRRYTFGSPAKVYEQPFVWQEGTGLVYLPIPAGYGQYDAGNNKLITMISIALDGSLVHGTAYVDSGPLTGYAKHVVWNTADGTYQILPGVDAQSHFVDVTYGDATPIPRPTIWSTDPRSGGTGDDFSGHRYIRVPPDMCPPAGSDHLFFGRVFVPFGSGIAATVERSGSDFANDVLTTLDPVTSATYSAVTGAALSSDLLVGRSGQDAHGANIPVKWVRPDRNSPYVESLLGIGTVGDTFVSDEGNVFAGSLAQYRTYTDVSNVSTTITDQVPAVWTAATGLVQLSPFIYTPGSNTPNYQAEIHYDMASDGAIVVGTVQLGLDDYARAWQNVDGVWSTIPVLNAQFTGRCHVVN